MSLEDWYVNSDGSIEVECHYSSCCDWGIAYGTLDTEAAELLYQKLKAIFESKECSE